MRWRGEDKRRGREGGQRSGAGTEICEKDLERGGKGSGMGAAQDVKPLATWSLADQQISRKSIEIQAQVTASFSLIANLPSPSAAPPRLACLAGPWHDACTPCVDRYNSVRPRYQLTWPSPPPLLPSHLQPPRGPSAQVPASSPPVWFRPVYSRTLGARERRLNRSMAGALFSISSGISKHPFSYYLL
jgi:hypothetical protein